MAPNLAAGGGIAVVGIILAAVVQGTVVDITGGIMTGVGLLFAAVTLGLNRNRIINSFKTEIEKGRRIMEYEVSEKLNDYTQRIKTRIDNNFTNFDNLLAEEKSTLKEMEQTYATCQSDFTSIKNQLLD
jgi:hypothetical protein